MYCLIVDIVIQPKGGDVIIVFCPPTWWFGNGLKRENNYHALLSRMCCWSRCTKAEST